MKRRDVSPMGIHFKILRNFSFLASGKIFSDVFVFVFFVVISRVFGQEGLGQYSFASAFTGFFIIFSDFGFYHLSIKDMSRQTIFSGKYFGKILVARFVLSLVVIFFMLIFLFFSTFSIEFKIVIGLIGLYQIIYTIFDGICAIFVAFEDMYFAGLLDFILKASASFVGILLCLAGCNLSSVLIVFPVMTIILSFFSYKTIIKKYGKIQFLLSFSFLKDKIQEAVPYMVSILLGQVSTRIDVVLIGFLLGSAATGIYNAAYRIVFLLMFLPHFVSMAIFPIVSKLYLTSQTKNLSELCKESLNWVIIIGLPATAGLYLIAPELIFKIFGKNFEDSVILLRLLSWLLFFSCFKSILSIFLTACDRQKERTVCQWYAAFISVAANTILILYFGTTGAAIAILLSEMFLTIVLLIRVKLFLGWPKIIHRLVISSIASASFLFTITYCFKLSMFFEIITAILIYTGVLILFKTIRDNEFRTFNLLIKSVLKYS